MKTDLHLVGPSAAMGAVEISTAANGAAEVSVRTSSIGE